MVLAVVPAVSILFLDPAADLDLELGSYGKVTAVEENVEVRSQEKPVIDAVGSIGPSPRA
jgi:hypothetical protein